MKRGLAGGREREGIVDGWKEGGWMKKIGWDGGGGGEGVDDGGKE